MSVSDFKLPKNANVPIVGQPPPHVTDAYGRILQAGDFIQLMTAAPPPFRVQSVVPVPNQNVMEVTVSCTHVFQVPKGARIHDAARVLSREEVDNRKAGKAPEAPLEAPAANPSPELDAEKV
jgi:hypothetical protein